MKRRRHELHTLTGCYALDAISGPERDVFERHLAHCQSCSAEVSGLRESAAKLAVATAMVPPERMRATVLDTARRTRQLPPVVQDRPVARPRRWVTQVAVGTAAAATAAAIGLGITQADTQQALSRAQARQQSVAAVLLAPDAHVATRPTADGGTVTAVYSTLQNKMVVISAGLPHLTAGQVYELWTMRAGRAEPAGLLHGSASGYASGVLTSTVHAGVRLGITVEPAGGTSHPTSRLILDMPLSD